MCSTNDRPLMSSINCPSTAKPWLAYAHFAPATVPGRSVPRYTTPRSTGTARGLPTPHASRRTTSATRGSSPMPAVWVSRCRNVTSGPPGGGSMVNVRRYLFTGSSSSSRPRSRSCIRPIAVIVFEIDAMRNTVSGVDGPVRGRDQPDLHMRRPVARPFGRARPRHRRDHGVASPLAAANEHPPSPILRTANDRLAGPREATMDPRSGSSSDVGLFSPAPRRSALQLAEHALCACAARFAVFSLSTTNFGSSELARNR